jgi:hypothetical protein
MRILFAIALLITFAAADYGQESKKIIAENVRSSEKIVKGAPFSAEAVSESVQMFADGNRIIRRATSRLYRDSEGRFRREDMPKQIGIPGAVIEMPESILILDPVAGYKYILNTKKNTFRQSAFKNDLQLVKKEKSEFKLKTETKPLKKEAKNEGKDTKGVGKAGKDAKKAETAAKRETRRVEMAAKRAAMQAERVAMQAERAKRSEMARRISISNTEAEKRAIRDAKTESLGVKKIEGVEADGTRTTTTIPASSIGNEREIDIVYEKWYSKDLQMIVLSRHNDPGFGEQTYRLTNIRRNEPQMSLFSPPADYQISEDKRPQPKPAPVKKVMATPGVPSKPAEPSKPSDSDPKKPGN